MKGLKMDNEEICDSHAGATTLDDRYNITDKEKLQTVKSYTQPLAEFERYVNFEFYKQRFKKSCYSVGLRDM